MKRILSEKGFEFHIFCVFVELLKMNYIFINLFISFFEYYDRNKKHYYVMINTIIIQ